MFMCCQPGNSPLLMILYMSKLESFHFHYKVDDQMQDSQIFSFGKFSLTTIFYPWIRLYYSHHLFLAYTNILNQLFYKPSLGF